MKNHEEIHDAIEQCEDGGTRPLLCELLHAMNDRILATDLEFAKYALHSELRELERRIAEIEKSNNELRHQLDDLNQTHE